MFAFRSFALGLLGACCLLLAMRPPVAIVSSAPGQILVVSAPRDVPHSHACHTPAQSPVTVVDVAPGITSSMLASLIVLASNERIASIDDAPVADGATALAALSLQSRRYVDITVENDAHVARRVLVLLR